MDVHILTENGYVVTVYDEKSVVPVRTFNGCSVDLAVVFAES